MVARETKPILLLKLVEDNKEMFKVILWISNIRSIKLIIKNNNKIVKDFFKQPPVNSMMEK